MGNLSIFNGLSKNIKSTLYKNRHSILILILSSLIAIHLFLIVFFQREIFFQKYDVGYWKERLEHSQWKIPLSTRSISDDALFSYVGYELIKGADPTLINVETPPLGKYIFGLSIIVFNNAIYLSFLAYLTLTVLLYKFFKFYIFEVENRLLLVLIIILNPIIYLQGYTSLLDIFQLIFLLISLVSLNLLNIKNNKIFAFISGASLGLFFGIKFPLLFPIFLIYQSYMFLRIIKKINYYLLYLLGLIIFILLPYLRFFMLGNNILDFIKIQKFILNFYSISEVDLQEGAIWIALFFGRIPDLVSRQLEVVDEWLIIWPVILVLFLLYFLKIFYKNKKDRYIKGLYFVVLSSLFIYTFIPFYVRYLVVILPFIYLFAYLSVSNIKVRTLTFLFILIISFLSSFNFLRPNPNKAINNFIFNIENQNFNDIYELQLAKNELKYNRSDFHKINKKFFYDASIEQLNLNLISIQKINNNEMNVKFKFTYNTRFLGEFSEIKNIKFVKENSKWKPSWNWNISLNGLEPEFIIITNREVGKRGAIYDSMGNILAIDTSGYLISINPSIYDSKKEQEMIDLISKEIFIEPVNIQNGYLNDPVLGYVDIGTNFKELNEIDINKLKSFKGVRVENYPVRIYENLDPKSIANYKYTNCCTNIYSSSSYKGVSGIEKQFEDKLKGNDGGSILIMSNNKIIRTVLKIEKKDGEDVFLSK